MTNAENYVYIESSNPVQPVAPEKEETEMLRATDKITDPYYHKCCFWAYQEIN